MQGLDAVAAVGDAVETGERFAVAFIDVRMPPGIDGKETAKRIRELDPDINLVIVTGYSDFSPLDISRAAGPADKIFYIAKPFQAEEVIQTATALGHRWQVDRELGNRARGARREDRAARGAEARARRDRNPRPATWRTHDSLTDAPNPARLPARAHRACPRPGLLRDGDDGPRSVQDRQRQPSVTLAGDELIRLVCEVLQENVGDDGMVARWAATSSRC
ncbi:MAG: response regulator [Sphingomonas sp.]